MWFLVDLTTFVSPRNDRLIFDSRISPHYSKGSRVFVFFPRKFRMPKSCYSEVRRVRCFLKTVLPEGPLSELRTQNSGFQRFVILNCFPSEGSLFRRFDFPKNVIPKIHYLDPPPPKDRYFEDKYKFECSLF